MCVADLAAPVECPKWSYPYDLYPPIDKLVSVDLGKTCVNTQCHATSVHT